MKGTRGGGGGGACGTNHNQMGLITTRGDKLQPGKKTPTARRDKSQPRLKHIDVMLAYEGHHTSDGSMFSGPKLLNDSTNISKYPIIASFVIQLLLFKSNEMYLYVCPRAAITFHVFLYCDSVWILLVRAVVCNLQWQTLVCIAASSSSNQPHHTICPSTRARAFLKICFVDHCNAIE